MQDRPVHASKRIRVYILAEREFPSGNAGGTRVRYLAKTLQRMGYEVIVFSLGENNDKDYVVSVNGFIFDGIQYENYPLSKGIEKFFRRYIFSGLAAIAKLRCFGKGRPSKDIVIVYTSNALYALPVLLYVRKKYAVWMDVVEWFQEEQFPNAKFNVKYWLYRFCFVVLYPATRQVIAISSLIESEFKRRGCKTILIPSLYDAHLGDGYPPPSASDTINLIYSGNPGTKENITSMFKGLIEVPVASRERFKFHFTGVTRREISKLLGSEFHLLDMLQGIVIFHAWMAYQDLLKLYAEMHFLYFVREPTVANLANFPTKLPELMTFGVVPLTTRIGDYGKYLIDGVNAIVINDCDHLTCRDALNRVLSLTPSQCLQLRSGAKECVRENFDFRAQATRIERSGFQFGL